MSQVTITEAARLTGWATSTLRQWAEKRGDATYKGRPIARKSGSVWLLDRAYVEERIPMKRKTSIQKQRITRKLEARGLYWTGEKELFPDDGIEDNIHQRATYHIYDADLPSRQDCLKFRTLADIEDWLAEWDTIK